ncbi:MAG TPA: substrate-binding domain-containing protein [Usitatibacter sp.]|jgi:molybdate transport system substrate-binding protein|nr:substrate-binding domain-containing protein [Usitatibacter sp.]
MSGLAGISSMATRHVLADLAQAFHDSTGRRLAIESVGGVEAARRIEAGEAFDIAVLAADAVEKLEAQGHVVRGSRVDIACSGIAIAVAAGAVHPGISSEEAVRRAVLAARHPAYSTGPSGTRLLALFRRWGILAQLEAHLVQAPAGVPVAALLARGEADLGFQQLSELIHETGIEVVGMLPPAIQAMTVFSGAICTTSRDPTAARGLLEFLARDESAKRRHGMEPAVVAGQPR